MTPSSKRTLNQAVGALRNRAHMLKLPPGIVSKFINGAIISFGDLRFCLTTDSVIQPDCIVVNYRDDSSMKSAIEELKKAAGKAPAK